MVTSLRTLLASGWGDVGPMHSYLYFSPACAWGQERIAAGIRGATGTHSSILDASRSLTESMSSEEGDAGEVQRTTPCSGRDSL